MLLLIGLSLPVLAVVRLLGGVEVWQMLAVLCVCTVFALSCAAIGLFYSSLLNRAYAVILLSYGTMFVIYFLTPLFVELLAKNNGNSSTYMYLLFASNPVATVAYLSEPSGLSSMPGQTLFWVSSAIVQLCLTALLLTTSSLILRRHARGGHEATVAATVISLPPPLPEDAPFAAVKEMDHSIPIEMESREIGDNPVLWCELREPLLSRKWAGLLWIGVITLLLISYGCFASADGLKQPELQIFYAFVFNGLYWLLVAVLSATAIAQEKESDTWTVLLASASDARQIVIGKLLGLMRACSGRRS